MDRNREALFSSLGDVVVGAAVLDLFAGTGSLGLEALSRGASSAVFVEWNPPAVAVLRENVGKVGLGGSVAATDVVDFVNGSRETFDLVFVDPPYELPLASVQEVLELLVDLLNPSAIVMLHRRAGDTEPTVPDALELTWHRQYGDAHIWRFTRKSEETER
jgi:16S rRNA (guanine966-N2)-methyltransferase